MATLQENIDDKLTIGVIRRLAPKLGLDVPDFGTEVSDKRIFEELISYKRNFETNTYSPITVSKHIDSLTDLEKENLSTLFKRVENMPNFWEEGGTGYMSAVKDYGTSLLTDPANLAGIAAGAVTMGVLGAPTRASLGAASLGVRAYAKNKLKAAFSKQFLGSVAAESAVTGLAGGLSEGKRIAAKEDIGYIDKLGTKEKLLQQAKVGVIEGPGSVLAGNFLSGFIGTASKIPSSAYRKITGEELGHTPGMQWIKNKFLPKSIHDADAARITETNRGETNALNSKAQVLDDTLRSARLKAFKGREKEGERLVNKALQGDSAALASLPTDVKKLAIESRNYIKEISDKGVKDTDGMLHKNFINMLRGNNVEADYLRKEYEVFKVKKGIFTSGRAQTFKSFLKENPTTISQVIEHVQQASGSGKRWFDALNEVDKKGIKQNILLNGSGKALEKEATKLAKNLYQPREGGFKIQGNLKTRQKLPQFQRKLWGENYTPDGRISSTIAGINNVIQKTKLGAQLSRNLFQRGLGVEATDKLGALEQFRQKGMNVRDVVRVSGEGALGAKDVVVRIEAGRLSSDAPTVWIPKEMAAPLKQVTDSFEEPFFNFGGLAGTVMRSSANIQGTLKVNMTALNFKAHVRNGIGMVQSVAASGNLPRAAFELTTTKGKVVDKDFLNAMKRMGVTSTSVDIEQMLTRWGRDLNSDPTLLEKIFTWGVAAIPPIKGKSVYRGALKFYQMTDDVGKIAAYIGEKSYQKSLWNNLPDAAKAARREQVETFIRSKDKLLKDPLAFGKRKLTDDEIISELSAQEVLDMMPVYTRVPPILEDLRNIPLIGNFTAYTAENFRNAMNITAKAFREMEEGFGIGVTTSAGNQLIRRSTSRLASLAAMGGGAAYIAHNVNEAAGYTVEKLEALKPFVPPWIKYSSFIVRDIEDNGDLVYSDVGYLSAYDPVISVFAPIMAGLAAGESADKMLTENLPTAASNFLSPYTDPSLLFQGTKALANLIGDKLNIEGFESSDSDFRDLYRSWTPIAIRDITEAAQRAGAFKDNEILGVPTPFNMKDIETVLFPKYAKEQYNNPDLDIGDFLLERGVFTGLSKLRTNLKTASSFVLNQLYENSREDMTDFKAKLDARLRDPNADLQADELVSLYEDAIKTEFAAQEEAMELFEDLSIALGDRRKAENIFLSKEVKAGPNVFKHTVATDPVSVLTDMNTKRIEGIINDIFLRNVDKYGEDVAIARLNEYRDTVSPRLKEIYVEYNDKRLKQSLPVED